MELARVVWRGKSYEITEDNVVARYTKSKIEKEVELEAECLKFICENLQVSNCIRFLKFGKGTVRDEQFLMTLKSFIWKNIEGVKSHPEFLELSPEMVEILFIPGPAAGIHGNGSSFGESSPTLLFQGLYGWMRESMDLRLWNFDKLLEKFPLDLICSRVLGQVLCEDDELVRIPKLRVMFVEAMMKVCLKNNCECKREEQGATAGTSGTGNRVLLSSEPTMVVAGTSTASTNLSQAIPVEQNDARGLSPALVEAAAGTPRTSSVQEVNGNGVTTIDRVYKPSAWITEVVPKPYPYFPQTGDDLVYFRQGHEIYKRQVLKKRAYPTTSETSDSLPYIKDPALPAQISVQLVAVGFKNYGPRGPIVAILTLARTHWETRELLGSTFSVQYHDMEDVPDFLVLRQVYESGMQHPWKSNDRFRCLHGNSWYQGTVTQVNVPCEPSVFPDSHFLSILVLWDDDNRDEISPWELEEITEEFRLRMQSHSDIDEGIPATVEELQGKFRKIFHGKERLEWQETAKTSSLLEFIMVLPGAKPCLSPYAKRLESKLDYPMNLSTIKARLNNSFYRRAASIEADILILARNAETCFPADETFVSWVKCYCRMLFDTLRGPTMMEESLNQIRHRLSIEHNRAFGEKLEIVPGKSSPSQETDGNRTSSKETRNSPKKTKGNLKRLGQGGKKVSNPVGGTKTRIVKKKKVVQSKLTVKCRYCPYRNTSSLVKQHQRKHTGEKPLVCPDCSRKFRYPASLHKHRKSTCKEVNIPVVEEMDDAPAPKNDTEESNNDMEESNNNDTEESQPTATPATIDDDSEESCDFDFAEALNSAADDILMAQLSDTDPATAHTERTPEEK